MMGGFIKWEHRPGEEFVLRIKPPQGKIVPEEIKSHIRAARKEMLLAMRSLIDSALTRLDEKKKGNPSKIEVE